MSCQRTLLTATVVIVVLQICAATAGAQPPAGPDVDGALEQAVKAAVARVAPSVVQIETTGGTDVVGASARGPQIRRGTGPTTGLVVSPDGYVISSAFNFANQPAAIFVAVPGHPERFLAKVVATDHTRMLTLLKTDAAGLLVPEAAPRKDVRVGQWVLALGRTWTTLDNLPSVSAGIISAVGRIWGKAVQTDAKVSPVNYGGPLIDLEGRVVGVLVPASPRGQDETAGVEWYDSGIGFAIPLEDVNAVLPRLKEGKDLKKGLLGITLQSTDIFAAKPVIASVAPESAAAKAGIKPGDTVVEINGHKVVRQAQILHVLGDKYEGDTVSVKVQRDKDELNLPDLKLTGAVSAFIHPFLGILPVRDDPALGEEVRYVFPKSPAEAAGLKPGDRILKVGLNDDSPLRPFSGRDQLTTLLSRLTPGLAIKLEVERKEGKKKETLMVTLGVLSDDVPATLPEAATQKKALEPRQQAGPMPRARDKPDPDKDPEGKREPRQPPKKEEPKEEVRKKPEKVDAGLLKRTTATGDREYLLYVPEDYDANVAHSLVLWLHPANKGSDKDLEAWIGAWQEFSKARHLILVAPRAEEATGWLASDVDAIERIAREVMDQYTVDTARVVVHGMGIGGQMAFYLGLNDRSLVRGVATTGAALTSQPKDNVADQRLAFFLVAGGKDPLAPAVRETKAKLGEHRFPVVYRELPERGNQYLDADTLEELVRWIDALDRQ